MRDSDQSKQVNKKFTEIKAFPVPFSVEEIQENLTIYINKSSKKELINQAVKFHSQGKVSEAVKYYRFLINQGFNDHRIFSNYGNILKDLGKLKEAELCQRRAIEMNPNFAKAHYNLGNILIDLDKLKEAELYTRKAIELNPNFAESHLNLGRILRELNRLKEAEISTIKAIELNPQCATAYCNLGSILRDLCRLKEAEISTIKAIEINPHSATSYFNLGNILIDRGKLENAELSIRKAIKLNPDLAIAYFSLSTLKYSDSNKVWQNKLFSESILKNQSKINKINIYFARANILHNEKNYQESSRYLKLANNIKLDIQPTKTDLIINKSKLLIIESNKTKVIKKEEKQKNFPESIFIVGMPRSGSTLLESILSINNNVHDLGEVNILEESFLRWKKIGQDLTLAELYWKEVNDYINERKTTTNKWLYNYQYAGIISNQIPNAKIIHCYRNPLDNILSIYRAHFARKNEYSSSLIDCTNIYINHDKIMAAYKKRFRSKIYDLNYDWLVKNPSNQIKDLISWLGWEWQESYLSPHLNPRSVSTASSVQVRSPINSKSIGGWKNYKDMLKPAIEILRKTDRYRDLTY